MLATALHLYVPEAAQERSHLALAPGETVEVLRQGKEGGPRLSAPWALGRLRGRTGWFPSSYVRRVPPAAERSARTERLLEALARCLEAKRQQLTPQGAERPVDVPRVFALLAQPDVGAGGGEPAGSTAVSPGGQQQRAAAPAPLSRSLLGWPTADVLLTAAAGRAASLHQSSRDTLLHI